MPPRYAYWTILIDAQPTAFRAHHRQDLLPTVHQLKRTNQNVEVRWFAHGRLWDTPEQAEWARRHAPAKGAGRGPNWRPGGAHKDPRARFKRKPKQKAHAARPWREEEHRERSAAAPAGRSRPRGAPSAGRKGPGTASGRPRKAGHKGPRKPRS